MQAAEDDTWFTQELIVKGKRITVIVDGGAITVLDAGPGIPEADRSRVFDRFHRVEATRPMPGSGLGLSIVRTLVTTELAGTIEMMPASVDDLASAGLDTGGTAHGTVVRLRVPTSEE